MSVHSTTSLASGHTLTIEEVARLERSATTRRNYFRVLERNELGTFIRFAYSTYTLADAKRWCRRQVELEASDLRRHNNHPRPAA